MIKINYYVFWVALRYFIVKRKSNFSSFIATISIIGIALGVMVLVTVLSVMNGFSKEIRAKILSSNAHITLKSISGNLLQWQEVATDLSKDPDLTAIVPYIAQHGLLSYNGISKPIVIIGVDPWLIDKIYPLADDINTPQITELITQKFSILIGNDLANTLGVSKSEQVTLILPQVNFSLLGITPKIKSLKIAGIFNSNTPYDQNYIFLNLRDASLLNQEPGVSGIQIKILDELQAPKIANKLAATMNYKYLIYDWTKEFSSLFDAMKMEKTVMTCILLLIIAVAAFNLVSSLIMLVMDKRTDLAILQVLGATTKDVVLIFMLQGIFIGLVGTIIGIGSGIILALNITDLVNYLQNLFGCKLIPTEAYLIGFVPSQLHILDLIWVGSAALIMSFVATLYPAYHASKIKPAEALRYE